MLHAERERVSRARPNPRYFVPDLTPMAHPELRGARLKRIFVAESPHVSEIAPDEESERRPLCGVAGRAWWATLSEILQGEANDDVSLKRLLSFCKRHGLVVMNAVQYPLDSKIAGRIPGADPLANLGFDKGTGAHSYKKLKNAPSVRAALRTLRERLEAPALSGLPIHCLGNDAEWFVKQSLEREAQAARVSEKIPHPSAWWRQGGHFGRVAEERLRQILRPS